MHCSANSIIVSGIMGLTLEPKILHLGSETEKKEFDKSMATLYIDNNHIQEPLGSYLSCRVEKKTTMINP